MRKELIYEYSLYPPAEKAFKCLCDRMELEVHEKDAGGGLRATNKDRSLIAQLGTITKALGGLKVVVNIRVSEEDHLIAVLACFGEPQSERQLGPSAKGFAEAVLATKLGNDKEAFIDTVCEKLRIHRDRFGSFRAMVITTSGLPGASAVLKKAAKKLREL